VPHTHTRTHTHTHAYTHTNSEVEGEIILLGLVKEEDGVWLLGCFLRHGLVRGDGPKNTVDDSFDDLNNFQKNPQDIKSLTEQGDRVELARELEKELHKDQEGNQKDIRQCGGITLEARKKDKYMPRLGIDTGELGATTKKPKRGKRILEKEHLGKPIPVLYENSDAITWIPREIHEQYYSRVPTVDRLEWEAKNWDYTILF